MANMPSTSSYIKVRGGEAGGVATDPGGICAGDGGGS